MSIFRNDDRPPADGSRPAWRIPPKLILAGVIGLMALIGYVGRSSVNPYTGEKQRVALSFEQEVALGMQSAPQMAQQFGGEAPDPGARALVQRVGASLVASVERHHPDAPKYPFEFHVLADRQTINAFALPGGYVFITAALLERLQTEGQLAGVLGHEVGHVIGRHSAEHIAQSELIGGLVSAVGVAGSDQYGRSTTGQIAQAVGQLVNLKYGRSDELEADRFGLRFMHDAGYDPRAMIGVMEILQHASGGSGQPEFMATHPNPGNRIERIEQTLKEMFPQGVPAGLRP